MFTVEVETPEGQTVLGPFTSKQEAAWRAHYERSVAEYLWGNEARQQIGARIVKEF